MKRFRFIGQDGSMGFTKGKIYTLKLFNYETGCFVAGFRENFRRCPYSSLKAFLANWEEIQK